MIAGEKKKDFQSSREEKFSYWIKEVTVRLWRGGSHRMKRRISPRIIKQNAMDVFRKQRDGKKKMMQEMEVWTKKSLRLILFKYNYADMRCAAITKQFFSSMNISKTKHP